MPLLPFSGSLRKLVVAFDVGTTFSGIAYVVLDPGEIPKIHNVTRQLRFNLHFPWPDLPLSRFPGQENGDFKIPSIMWYTQAGKVYSAGAEARDSCMDLVANDENLIFVEWCASLVLFGS